MFFYQSSSCLRFRKSFITITIATNVKQTIKRRNQTQHLHALPLCSDNLSDSTWSFPVFASASWLERSITRVSFLTISPAARVCSFSERVKLNISSATFSCAAWWACNKESKSWLSPCDFVPAWCKSTRFWPLEIVSRIKICWIYVVTMEQLIQCYIFIYQFFWPSTNQEK